MEKPQTDGEFNLFSFKQANLAVVIISFLTVTVTFFISNSNFSFPVRTTIFAAVLSFYMLFCIGFYFFQSRLKSKFAENEENAEEVKSQELSPETLEKLLCLEETNNYFANSLKNIDVFRLVSYRINEMVPFSACMLILIDENTKNLKIVQANGENADSFLKIDLNNKFGLVKKTIESECAEFDEKLLLESQIFEKEILNDFNSAAAFPLMNENKTAFGAIEVFFTEETIVDEKTLILLNEIEKRVSPLFIKSLTFEKNLENSLTDPITKLPNERAFYLILENQIAESQRFRGERSLTVLCADIQQFDELNKKYGFAAGDRILKSTAKLIKSQLRQMDFLARSNGDEFWAILPTATAEITKLIVERIEKAFSQNTFGIAENQDINVKLNFGTATFMADGETASELLQKARLKKHQAKSAEKNGSVLFGSFIS